ncbi:hypothetical protein NOU13_28090 [Rhodococcus erythropolis]|uniref:hypothetical protein n=1 Tax=Rhodococcus TaxID=1827 RepID=UPI00210E7235|nr:hypothetical protein [Rhodococcus erythropolis]MCQ4128366.1 hypothetical protein [Rhodococcus erythropolis]
MRKTRNGLEAARRRGKVGGRPTVVDGDKCAAILARRDRDESIREIAAGVGVSVDTVHRVLAGHATDAQINAARTKLIIDNKLKRTPKPHIEKPAELKSTSERRPVAS